MLNKLLLGINFGKKLIGSGRVVDGVWLFGLSREVWSGETVDKDICYIAVVRTKTFFHFS